MREARYMQEETLAAEGSGARPVAPGQPDEPFLVFATSSLGLCALPIGAVQAVCAADGPVRRVPLRGGAGSRFLGLVSVRGQVQLLFDLSRTPAPPVLAPPAATQSQGYAGQCAEGAPAPPAGDPLSAPLPPVSAPPASDPLSAPPSPVSASFAAERVRGEHVLVATAADGRTLALRVLPPLRLVRRSQLTEVCAPQQVDASSLVCGIFALADAGASPGGAAAASRPADPATAAMQGTGSLPSGAVAAMRSPQPLSADPAEQAAVSPSQPQAHKVSLLAVERLFAQLEAEARHG